MKLKYSVIAAALLIAFVSMPFVAVAQDARAQIIAQRCTQLRGELGDLQRRDLVSRTNMGREYENTDKQLNAFTQRVHNNNFNEQSFVQLLTQYREAVTKFRISYVAYDDAINALQAVNCVDNASEFSSQLDKTRLLRQATNDAVNNANSLLTQYRALMVQLQNELPQESSR